MSNRTTVDSELLQNCLFFLKMHQLALQIVRLQACCHNLMIFCFGVQCPNNQAFGSTVLICYKIKAKKGLERIAFIASTSTTNFFCSHFGMLGVTLLIHEPIH